jgi:hypothetical protein
VARQVAGPDERVRIYATGGVFSAGAIIMRPFRDAVRAGWPTAEVSQPDFPPSVGALIRARRLCGLPVDDEWLRRVRESLPLQ